MSDSFGAKLKKYRIAAGLTQAQLAEKSSISRKQISDFEMNLQKNPKSETMKKLADAFNITVEMFLGENMPSNDCLPVTEQKDSFGLRLRYFRSALNLTQQQLADKSGVSRKQISDFEKEIQKNPRENTLKKLADSLNVSIYNLKPDMGIPKDLDEDVKRSIAGEDVPNIVKVDIDTSDFPEEFFEKIKKEALKNNRTFDEEFNLCIHRLINKDMNKVKLEKLNENQEYKGAEEAFKNR